MWAALRRISLATERATLTTGFQTDTSWLTQPANISSHLVETFYPAHTRPDLDRLQIPLQQMRSYIASKPSAFSFPPIRTDDLDQTFFSGAPHSVGSLDSIQNEAIRKLTLPLHGTTLIRGQVGGFPLRQLFAVASKSRASTETEKPHGGDFERRCVMLTDDATVVLKNMKTLDPLPLLRTSEFKSVSVLTVQRLR